MRSAAPGASLALPYEVAKHAMRRMRSTLYPRNLKTPAEVTAFLERRENPICESYLKTVRMNLLGKEERMVFLFFPDLLLKVDDQVTSYLFDATFRTCPAGFYQAFNVAADIRGQVTLLFTILMTKKAYELYFEALRTIRDEFPQIKPLTATADFESAILKAIAAVFPDCEVTGCQFHSGHAINKKMKTFGIHRWIKSDHACNLLYRKYLSLSFIPARDICTRLRGLRLEIESTLPAGAKSGFKKFHLYIKSYWIRRVRPERLSVFGKQRRTNNGLESTHAMMSRHLVKHANIFRFITGMRTNIWFPTLLKIQSAEAGFLQRQLQKSKQRKREEHITHWQGMYLRKEISLSRYHSKMAELYHSYEKKLKGPGEGRVLRHDIEDEFNFEDPPQQQPAVTQQAAQRDDSDTDEDNLPETGRDRGRDQGPPRREDAIHSEDEDFQLEDGWPDLDLSDDDLLQSEDQEDTAAELALQADRHLNQLVPECPICFDELKDPCAPPCGHLCCLDCFSSMGIILKNPKPYPECPQCRIPFKYLVRIFIPRLTPRHEMMDKVVADRQQANNDLNPVGKLLS